MYFLNMIITCIFLFKFARHFVHLGNGSAPCQVPTRLSCYCNHRVSNSVQIKYKKYSSATPLCKISSRLTHLHAFVHAGAERGFLSEPPPRPQIVALLSL